MIGVDMGPTPGLGSKPSPGVNLGAEPGVGGPVDMPWESIIQDGTRDMHGRTFHSQPKHEQLHHW